MANKIFRNKANVLLGAPDVAAAGGAVSIVTPAADKTLYPTDAVTELNEGLNPQPGGYVTPDGLSKAVEIDTEDIEDWNGDLVLRPMSKRTVTLSLTFMETANESILKIVNPEGAVSTDDTGKVIEVKDLANDNPHFGIVFEIKGSRNRKIRIYAPYAQITDLGDIQYTRSSAVQYEATITCYVDDHGAALYTWIQTIDDTTADKGTTNDQGTESPDTALES